MGKQPYIPLYIGDWESDTNSLSVEAEGAWLKIIFKIWKQGKTGVYKTDTKSLQNLWRSSPEKVAEILRELTLNKVAIITDENGEITIINRRMRDEYLLGKKRSNAVQTRYKNNTNTLHPSEDEYESESEVENRNEDINTVEGEFETFRLRFPGRKRGFATEFELFKKHKDWKEVIPLLLPAVEAQIAWRATTIAKDPNAFVPSWKNLKTWLNNRCWEEETGEGDNGSTTTKPQDY